MQQEYQIKYLRAAMRDLEGIAQLYLGLAGADSAEKFIDEILHTVDLLRTFPASGYGVGRTGVPKGGLPRLCMRL